MAFMLENVENKAGELHYLLLVSFINYYSYHLSSVSRDIWRQCLGYALQFVTLKFPFGFVCSGEERCVHHDQHDIHTEPEPRPLPRGV